jgi:hypothetical protein
MSMPLPSVKDDFQQLQSILQALAEKTQLQYFEVMLLYVQDWAFMLDDKLKEQWGLRSSDVIARDGRLRGLR